MYDTTLRPEFINPVPAKSYKNPLDYKFDEIFEPDWDHTTISHLRSLSSSCAGLTDVNNLKQRINEHVHICSLDHTPLSLRYLNQKFGLVATRLKTSTRFIIDELVSADKIKAVTALGKTGYFSVSAWNDINIYKFNAEGTGCDYAYLELLINNMTAQKC